MPSNATQAGASAFLLAGIFWPTAMGEPGLHERAEIGELPAALRRVRLNAAAEALAREGAHVAI